MSLRPIRTDHDNNRALIRIEALWGAEPGTPEGDELEILTILVERYEAVRYAIPPGDPAEIIRNKILELGWSQNQLAHQLGVSSGRVSELLSGKRALTASLVRRLAEVLVINPGSLLGDHDVEAVGTVQVRLPTELIERPRSVSEVKNVDAAVAAAVTRSLEVRPAIKGVRPRQAAERFERDAVDTLGANLGSFNHVAA